MKPLLSRGETVEVPSPSSPTKGKKVKIKATYLRTGGPNEAGVDAAGKRVDMALVRYHGEDRGEDLVPRVNIKRLR